MSIYTTSQSILIPSTMTRMVVQLYGAGGGGEGVVSSGVYNPGATGGNSSFLNLIAYGGTGGGVGGANAGGTGGSFDLSNWGSYGVVSGTTGGSGQITAGGIGGGSSGGSGGSIEQSVLRTVNFSVSREANNFSPVYLSATGYPTVQIDPPGNNQTVTRSVQIYTGVVYTATAGGACIRINGSTQIGLDDSWPSGDLDFNDTVVTSTEGSFTGGTYNLAGRGVSPVGPIYYKINGAILTGRGGGAGGYLIATVDRSQLIANGVNPGSSYNLVVNSGGLAGSGGGATSGIAGYANISFDIVTSYIRDNGIWVRRNKYIRDSGTWKLVNDAPTNF